MFLCRATRCCACLTTALAMLCAARTAAAEEFPYTAYVNATDVYVRSGPGRDYYPTDKLQKGQRVEVYRHDPGGWLAIRPPRDSFCWVSARQLDALGDDLAAANSDLVVVRVGSKFSDVRDVIQVRLEQDERVELLEAATGDSPWCKIAPPAGEFRWIFSKYVDRDLPADLAADEREADYPAADRDHADAGGEPAATSVSPEMVAAVPRLLEMDRIDLELSTIVLQDISQWNFDDLHRRAENAQAAAQDSLERGRARVLLDKIERFQDIRRRHDSLAQAPAAAPKTEFGVPSGFRQFSRVDDARYDGMGRLSPVVSQQTGGPQYALLDESGEVRSFVTPAPGVNLRPFVDKVIGVNGQRGYLTDMQRQHITVQRISLLDTQRR